MEHVSLLHVLAVSGVLFGLGAIGVLVRRNILILFMSVELMLNAVNLAFVGIARDTATLDGHVVALFVMAVAAAEAGVGLALVILLHRNRLAVHADELDLLKG